MSALDRHAEFEQLLRGMRDRLIAVSEEVSRTVTKANWHAETAPPHVRARVQTSIADITSTQDWLQARLAQLPEEPQQRYAAMQEMLQVQFVAVQKVTTILDELLALRNKPVASEYLPPDARPPAQLEPPLFTGGYPGAAAPDAGSPIARNFAPALATPATAPLFDAPVPRQPLFPLEPSLSHPQAHAQQHGAPASYVPHPQQQQPMSYPLTSPMPHAMQPHPQQPMEPYWESQREPQWGALAGGYPAQPHAPGAVHLADLEPTLAPPMGPGEMPRAFAPRQPEAPQKPPQKGARKYQRPAPRSRMGLVTAGLLAAILVVGAGGWWLWGSVAGGSKPQRIAIGDPAARKASSAGVNAAPVRSVDPIVARVPQAPPMSAPPFAEVGGGDDFVPVIATHRDKDGLTTMFMDLRKQYPGIVATRKAIAQTVNLGADGVWYQLVLLPPAPRAQAEAVCEELRRAGYPRCAVRPNKP